MQIGHVATPFGSRSMTLAMLASQIVEAHKGKSVDKWKLYRALCEARGRLRVTDRALALLNALLTFYPKTELSVDHGLVVFPSNAQLSTRAHGMAEPTIRRHLAVLVDAGLISRKDSANGKRYARRDDEGEIDEAFGFSLAPLLARADEIEMLAADAMAERLAMQRLRERFTICRRDVAKLIAAAIDEGAEGDWESHLGHYRALVEALPRSPTAIQLSDSLDEMELLRDGIVNSLKIQLKTQNDSANDLQSERHIQNSKPDFLIESEPRFELKRDAKTEPGQPRSGKTPERPDVKVLESTVKAVGSSGDSGSSALQAFPLGMVLRACPQIVDYAPGGQIGSWRELMATAVLVRSMLGVSSSAYQEACEVMGPESAATTVACILERAGHINSAGGYLRDLTRRAERGEFSLGPMIMALVKANAGYQRLAS